MNNWQTIRKIAIVEADDFQDRYDRNSLNVMLYWKAKYPKFKMTMYTIPNRTSLNMLKLMQPYIEDGWLELAVHGWDHESNFECYGWDFEKTKSLMQRVDKFIYQETSAHNPKYFYTKNFKAPGWTITPEVYKANSTDLIMKDTQAVYKALTELGYVVCDRHYNKFNRPQEDNIICIDCNPDIIHMHTWPMLGTDIAGKNGMIQVEEEHGVPWDENTEFYTMKEAWQLGLYQKCK